MFEDRLRGSDVPRNAIPAFMDALRPIDGELAALLHAVAHQLRTPLTSIIGSAELLAEGADGAGGQEDPIAPDKARLLQTITRNAQQMAALVDGLEPDGIAVPQQADPDARGGGAPPPHDHRRAGP